LNIALPALVIILIIFPGFVFRRWQTFERTSLDYSPFGQTVASGLITAVVLHSLWLCFAYVFCERELNIRALLGLLSSHPQLQEYGVSVLEKEFLWVVAYFGSQTLCAYVASLFLRKMIIRQGWHVRPDHWFFNSFRFDNAPWYNLLLGQTMRERQGLTRVFVTAIVEVGKEPLLYRGYVRDFHCNADGSLNRLVLDEAHRRELNQPTNTTDDDDDGFYRVKGDAFVLQYSDTKTLTIGLLRMNASDAETSKNYTVESLDKLLANDPIVEVKMEDRETVLP
jgi:hypothetical protein